MLAAFALAELLLALLCLQQSMVDSLSMLSSWVLPDLPFSISTEAVELLGDNVMQWAATLSGPLGFWIAWILAPGLQVRSQAAALLCPR
jgi:hypothetical protein